MRSGTNLLSTVKMYHFPTSSSRKLQWETALQRKNWKANPKSAFCLISISLLAARHHLIHGLGVANHWYRGSRFFKLHELIRQTRETLKSAECSLICGTRCSEKARKSGRRRLLRTPFDQQDQPKRVTSEKFTEQ
ncbi:hypothetical protein TNCV_3602691 [Trichonephila clavipes]|nr:hypothetical protein TNCV_3602691 [Trichonephila clavipes]